MLAAAVTVTVPRVNDKRIDVDTAERAPCPPSVTAHWSPEGPCARCSRQRGNSGVAFTSRAMCLSLTKGPGSRAAGIALAYKLIDAAQAHWSASTPPPSDPRSCRRGPPQKSNSSNRIPRRDETIRRRRWRRPRDRDDPGTPPAPVVRQPGHPIPRLVAAPGDVTASTIIDNSSARRLRHRSCVVGTASLRRSPSRRQAKSGRAAALMSPHGERLLGRACMMLRYNAIRGHWSLPRCDGANGLNALPRPLLAPVDPGCVEGLPLSPLGATQRM